METDKQSRRIFISASTGDRAFAEKLSNAIRDLGMQSFFDFQDIESGDEWNKKLMQELRSSDLLVFVLPSKEGEGKSALFEVGAATSLGKPIVVVVQDWTKTSSSNTDFAVQLSHNHIVDASRRRIEDVARSVISTAVH